MLNTMDMVLRLITAMLIGGLIGLERTLNKKPLGIKTHSILCIICTMLTITAAYGFTEVSDKADPSRLVSNIPTGIGFLCASVIIVTVAKDGLRTVKGLTTATNVWGTACLGIPIGLGLYKLVLTTYFLIQFSILIESKIKKSMLFNKYAIRNIEKNTVDEDEV